MKKNRTSQKNGFNAKFIKLSLLFSSLLLLTFGQVYSQFKVSGTVSDDKGVAVAGVSVQVKGATTGTSTDNDGHYTITVPNSKAVLVFTSVGFASREQVVGTKTLLN